MNLPLWDICARKHGGNPQSVKANAIAHKYKLSARQRILEALENEAHWFREAPGLTQTGMTCEDLESFTGLSHQTCSARLSELKNPNQPGGAKIKVVGERMTRSGSPASVYQAI